MFHTFKFSYYFSDLFFRIMNREKLTTDKTNLFLLRNAHEGLHAAPPITIVYTDDRNASPVIMYDKIRHGFGLI